MDQLIPIWSPYRLVSSRKSKRLCVNFIYLFNISPVQVPAIETQPISIETGVGGSASFTVMVSGEELKYQWFGPGGDTLSDIPGKVTGATTSNLEILNVQQGDTGKYRVSISNDGGSVNSDEATLSIGKA